MSPATAAPAIGPKAFATVVFRVGIFLNTWQCPPATTPGLARHARCAPGRRGYAGTLNDGAGDVVLARRSARRRRLPRLVTCRGDCQPAPVCAHELLQVSAYGSAAACLGCGVSLPRELPRSLSFAGWSNRDAASIWIVLSKRLCEVVAADAPSVVALTGRTPEQQVIAMKMSAILFAALLPMTAPAVAQEKSEVSPPAVEKLIEKLGDAT